MNPSAVYTIKGHEIRERQLFERSFNVQREATTGIYFIEDGKAFYIDDDGKAVRCNFSVDFLNRGYTKSIEPLDKFYGQSMGMA